MIPEETRTKIKGYLEGFIQGMIDEGTQNDFDPKKLRPHRLFSKKGDLKPFHESLLPDGLLRIAEFERSFSTKLGTTFEESARSIASANHVQAERGYKVEGLVSDKAIGYIEEVVSKIGSGGMKYRYLDLVKNVVRLSEDESGVHRGSIADLFVKTKTGEEWYFEIKSPKPNKGQCLEATGRLLQIHAITHKKYPDIRTFYATAYNPYGIMKDEYRHSFAVNYMDLASEVLIGKEFWDLIGGPGTYDEILSIYQEVGKEKGPDMLDQLALGY